MRLSTGRLLIAAALLGIGAAVMVVAVVLARPGETAWADQPRTVDLVDPLKLWIRRSDGSSQQQPTVAELDSKLPFTVELPGSLPEDYELYDINLVEAGSRANPKGPDALSVRYAGDLASLTFNQATGSSFGEVDGAGEVRVGDARGIHYTWTEPVSSEWLVWTRCNRVFSMWSVPEDKLSTADLVRIAESVGPEAC